MAVKIVAFLFLFVNICWAQTDLWQGSACTANGTPGICATFNDCPNAVESLRSGKSPVHCGFEGSTPIVCCPGGSKRIGEKAERMCKEYNEPYVFSLERDLILPPVVGGSNAKNGDFPHMAALGYGDKGDVAWKCGGSLISENYVLTAAHCLTSNNGPVKYVRLGDVNINGKSGTHKDYEVTTRISHPDYKPPSTYHDIALLKLDKNVAFDDNIKPACLHSGSDRIGPEIKATGWGLTEYGGSTSTVLQEVLLQLFSFEECNQVYRGSARRLPDGIRNETQVCAGGRDEEKDTCQGDSGGPLQVKFSNRLHQIIGVTSFGKSCGVTNLPGVYSRVSNYIEWIENIVWP